MRKITECTKKRKIIGNISFFPFINANFDFLINSSISDLTGENF